MSDTAAREETAAAIGNTFVWHEVYGASSAAATDFYTQALGWTVQEMPIEGMTYKMLVANGVPVAGVMGTDEMEGMDHVPPHWATYIGVDDLDSRLAKCVELGATVQTGPMTVPTIGKMALLMDPQGAHFWLFQGE